MKAWTISDTHNKHASLQIPKDVEMVIFTGDMSIIKDPGENMKEVLDFLEWFSKLPIKHKICIAGNHDTSIEHKLVIRQNMPLGITYLEHESVIIDNIKIFGSPYTPEFGKNWAFNVKKEDISEKWADIPNDTTILITHGPPKGILDLTKFGKEYAQCGCPSLLEKVLEIQPHYHIFGHVHSELECPNAAMLLIQKCKTVFINATVCDFKRIDDPNKKSIKNVVNNGFIIEI